MTQIHVAIFKWKEGVASSEIENALSQVRRVAQRVPGIRSIWCGANTSRWSQGFTHAVVVVGDDESALAAYRTDSIHELAAASIEKMELDGIGVDFRDPE